jgi:hypothetical protein
MCINLKISYSDYIDHKEPEKYEVFCVKDCIVPRYDPQKAEIVDKKLFNKGSVYVVTKFYTNGYDNSFSICGETIPSDIFSESFKDKEEIRDILISEILK